MSTAKTSSGTGKKPNLFKKAKDKAGVTTTKSTKGTVFQLPKDMDGDSLSAECKEMHDAVTDTIAASAAEKSAKGRGNTAKGVLNPWILRQYAQTWANLGVQPPTPVSLVNHKGDKLTYVVADKSQQYGLQDDQVELLAALLGETSTSRLVETVDKYHFDPDIMRQVAGDQPVQPAPDASDEEKAAYDEQLASREKVEDVVFELVQETVLGTDRLSDEQKEELIGSDTVTRLRRGMLSRLAEFTGGDTQRIADTIDALGSSCSHYLKP